MRIGIPILLTIVVLLVAAMMLTAGWDRPPVAVEQTGYRGLGMVQVDNPRVEAALAAANQVPEPPWPLEPSEGPLASEVYENVQVLGDVPSDHFDRLMAAITEWVAPEQGCTYCHNEENLAEDSVYTKIVARRMLQMTRHINGDWDEHVAATGVTCYTCHRGQPVPQYIWFAQPVRTGPGLVGNRTGQNMAAASVGTASLPADPFGPYLTQDANIRVVSNEALPPAGSGLGPSIKQAERTYGLMMHVSKALGVNCTFCHNSRSFFAWDQSTPQRTTAWYGIRMLRDLNSAYLEPLGPQYPHNRLGPTGDAPKANCATCHQGVSKPLLGASMVQDYPSLAGATP